jgi:hypothetical protein
MFFMPWGAILSDFPLYIDRALKHEYALSRHRPYVERQKGDTGSDPVLQTHVFQSRLRLL